MRSLFDAREADIFDDDDVLRFLLNRSALSSTSMIFIFGLMPRPATRLLPPKRPAAKDDEPPRDPALLPPKLVRPAPPLPPFALLSNAWAPPIFRRSTVLTGCGRNFVVVLNRLVGFFFFGINKLLPALPPDVPAFRLLPLTVPIPTDGT